MSGLDRRTADAQRRNAERMTDKQLDREIWFVTAQTEQPPIRVAWREVLMSELRKREGQR